MLRRWFFLSSCVFFWVMPGLALADHSKGYIRTSQKKIPVLSLPDNNSAVGSLDLVVDNRFGTSTYEFRLTGQSDKVDIHKDLAGTGYKMEESFYPCFYEVKSNFVKILEHSGKTYWMHISSVDLLVTPLTELMQYNGYQVSGYDNYRLRNGPGSSNDIVVKLNEKTHIVEKWTGKTNGSWAEVVVVELAEQDAAAVKGCESIKNDKVITRYTGWIKAVEDNGKPGGIRFVTSC